MNVRQPLPASFSNTEFDRILRSGAFGNARVELRRGMILKMNAQHIAHGDAKWLLARAIEDGLVAAGLPLIVRTEISVSFGEGFEPLPDIVVCDPTLLPADRKRPIPGLAVRLVAEVADTTLSDDLGEKLEDYANAGLAEYWVVDVNGRIILRHAGPTANTYARREPARFGETFSSLAYPTLRIDTAALA